MAVNEWINGYLEAILDSKSSNIEDSSGVNLRERGHFNPTKYFVEEVVTGVDETDLHRTWIKVVATRNTRERSSRLENMCWRIWHLTRKKKQLEWEDLQRIAKRRLEREQGRSDVREDMSEDLSEGEKVDILGDLESPPKTYQHTASDIWAEDKKEKKLYIILIRYHFNLLGMFIRTSIYYKYWFYKNLDAILIPIKYVVELARALARTPGVYRVDLFTRQVSSPEVDWSYGEPTEMLTTNSEDADDDVGESSGAYIIRIPFGPRDKYLRKELLWPHIQEFVDGALAHILNMSTVLGEQIGGGHPIWPYVIHGHYADAGDSAAILSGALNVPMVLTGHSLGRNKLEQLLKQGRQSKEDINSTYKIMKRIEAEELSLDAAELVITSTRQEIDEQWGLYDGFDVKLEKVLRARARHGVNCHGRFMPRMAVIPPGMDFSNVIQEANEADGDLSLTNTEGSSPKAVPAIWSEVMQFLTNPHKPMILALSRPDPKKNITTLLKAFGEYEMSAGNASVLTTVLKLVDKYDLYGQVAFPKHHKQNDVPEIYRLAAKTKNLWHECQKNGWKNIHLFSWPEHCCTYLTRVASCRMRHPMWKTDTPADEMPREESLNDSLRDVQDTSLFLSIDADRSSINESLDGGADIQDQVKRLMSKMKKPGSTEIVGEINNNASNKYPNLRKRQRLIIIAVDCYDNNGDPEKTMISMIQETFKAIKLDAQMEKVTGVAISTAMPLSELMDLLKSGKIKANEFDAMVCGSGSEVYYPGTYEEGGELYPDPDYATHVEYRWGSDGLKKTICKLMNTVEGEDAKSGKPSKQIEEDVKSSNSHCLSYLIKNVKTAKKVDDLRQKFRMRGLRCHVMYCRNSTRMQVIPLLASRAQALSQTTSVMVNRYFFVRWRLNVANMYVVLGETGDTDYEEMISGTHKTVIIKGVVKKGSEELLRSSGSYLKEDIVPGESPLIVYVNGTTAEEMANALKKVSKCDA
ncbi:Sucrose-phosphate synthase [Cynara cardunculus var. scolymus]|uniref:Sucrose-phosphate synthase n=1 Tax=Cynara cardunculus var. scolymus TaxID=59895 RepID=A0A124SH29_CYNCS|nr:Sucrose-phosphate synthase [Cynara cardunculus var. scolymus]